MTEQNGDDKKKNRSFLDEIQDVRANADKGREPEMLSSRMGTRQYSMGALLERIVDAFIAEHAGGTDALSEADTEAKRYKLILNTAEYVLGVESIQIADKDKAEIVRRAYTELFTYGPLDELFLDEQITTITLEGAEKAFVRYGHGDFTALDPLFDDEAHVRKIIKRLLLDSGAELTEDTPIIEAGLNADGRSIRVSVAGPPVTYEISVDIRLHPREPVTLDDLVEAEVMTKDAAELLTAIAQSASGIVIIGESESGKTTLLNALALAIPQAQLDNAYAVERAGEMNLPEAFKRLIVEWPMEGREAKSLHEQVNVVLEDQPSLIMLDEIRADEAQAVGRILTLDESPRQLWAFRGPANVKRLNSALSMVARQSIPVPNEGEGEQAVNRDELMAKVVTRLYQRLPFVVTVRRRNGKIQLTSIGEWQLDEHGYATLVELMALNTTSYLQFTGEMPVNATEFLLPILTLYSSKNEYPGINPHLNDYLGRMERGKSTYYEKWDAFHNAHVTHLVEYLAEAVPEGYRVEQEKSFQVKQKARHKLKYPTDTTDITVYSALLSEEFHRSVHIQRQGEGGEWQTITQIELLSPTMDDIGYNVEAEHKLYMDKRTKLLEDGGSIVELKYTLMHPMHVSRNLELTDYFDSAEIVAHYPESSSFPYMIIVKSGQNPQTVHGFGVDEPIPTVGIPLAEGETLTFDFGAVYNHTIQGNTLYTEQAINYRLFPNRFSIDDTKRIEAYMAVIAEKLGKQ